MRYFLLILITLGVSGCGIPTSFSAANFEPAVVQAQQVPVTMATVVPAGRVGQPRTATPIPSALPTEALPPPVEEPPPLPVEEPPPTAAPPPTETPAPPPLLPGVPAPILTGELAMRTYSIDFYRLPGGLSASTIQALAIPAEYAIISGTLKMNSGLKGRIAIRFEPPQTGPCAIRGLTLSGERTIRMFYEPDADPNRVLAILAHEFIHQLQHDYYGVPEHFRSDIILLEGMAVWASSPYFLAEDGRPLYHVRTQQARRDGTLLPLTTSLDADCRTTTRVNIYDQWGSFVEYLLLTYGREKLDAAYRDSRGRPAGSANYRGVYGKPLSQLEAEWIEWLATED